MLAVIEKYFDHSLRLVPSGFMVLVYTIVANGWIFKKGMEAIEG